MTLRTLRLAALMLLLASSSVMVAQVSQGGTPFSIAKDNFDWKIQYDQMESFDIQAMVAEDEANKEFKHIPYRFGKNFYRGDHLNNSGNWNTLPSGDRVWLKGYRSTDAYSLNLIFDQFYMPEGARMFVYSGDGTQVIGAFTSENNNSEEVFSTWPLDGESIVIEYYEPLAVQGQGRIQVESVTHAYRDLHKVAQGLGDSGACNNNVVCPEGDPWANEINSVAMIVVSGNGICTGSLLNNTANDGHPYFMTANHCVGGSVATWSYRFNWQSTTCVGNSPGGFDTVSGGTLLASNGGSDFAFLEINNGAPIPTAYNPYYAGWDATGVTPTESTGIHHPSGDIKKISFDTDPAGLATWGGAATWRIFTWEDGTTEPGSSGSPLYDQDHRFVGQLYGGTAACGNSIDDYYGRFDVTYPSVCAWLDPGCTAGEIDGYDPNTPTAANDAQLLNIVSPTGVICGETYDAEVTIRNAGTNTLTAIDITWDVNGGGSTVYNWTGSLASNASINVNLGSTTTSAGSHTFNATLSLPSAVDENPANDSGSSAFSTVAGGTEATLSISTDCWGEEVSWNIDDAGGTTVYSAAQGTIASSTTTTWDLCLAAGCYDFFINDSFGDGLYGSQYGSCTINGDYNITDGSANVLVQMTAPNADYGSGTSHNFCVPVGTPGCIDTMACNFDSMATVDDGSCQYLDECGVCGGTGTLGCTTPSACNYDPSADCDDGTCLTNDACGVCGGTGTVAGCTDNTACNYNAAADCDDGSCLALDACGVCGGAGTVAGCTDNTACNYNAAADCDDGSCLALDACGVCGGAGTVAGCTDNTACNYNAAADCDNGSCQTLDACGVCGGAGTIAGCTDNTACNYNAAADCDDGSCQTLDACGVCGGAGTIAGCTDNTACNYNAAADCDDGSCQTLDACGVCGGSGTVAGCTDTTACNYDSLADCDDSSCEYVSCAGCQGDFNGDNQRDVQDLLMFLSNYGCNSGNCFADLDGNGSTGTGDTLLFLTLFGVPCP